MDLGREVESLQRQAYLAGTQNVMRSMTKPFKDILRLARKRLRGKSHKTREPVFFILWFIWLLVGSIFYAFAPKSNLGIIKGFYMAINIGYSIGFGYPSEAGHGNYLYFSSIYVLLGASFVGVALGFFAEKITKDGETWFTKLQHEKEIEQVIREKDTMFQGSIQAWIYHNSSALKAVSWWLSIVIVMIIYSSVAIGWTFGEAQYFAVSTLSTGGHWPIPNDSPTWMFGLTAVLTMVGVPVMAVAMAEIAQVLISRGNLDEAKETIDAVVSKEELEFLQDLGLEDFDGKVDKAEFIILCMVRMGTDPGLIQYITQRFAELNFYTGQALTVAEITQGACKFHRGRIRRRESVQGGKLKVVSDHDQAVPEASKSYLDYYYRKGMDESYGSNNQSDGDLDDRSRRNRKPYLAVLPEGLSHSQHVRKIEQTKSCDISTPKQPDMNSSSLAPYNRTVSLTLTDVFQSSNIARDGASGYSYARSAKSSRVPRSERRDTSKPSMVGFGESVSENRPDATTSDNHIRLTSAGEAFNNTTLYEMEEGSSSDDENDALNRTDVLPANADEKESGNDDDIFLDEMEKGNSFEMEEGNSYSVKPNRVARIDDDLKREPSIPSVGDSVAASTSPAKVDGDTDDEQSASEGSSDSIPDSDSADIVPKKSYKEYLLQSYTQPQQAQAQQAAQQQQQVQQVLQQQQQQPQSQQQQAQQRPFTRQPIVSLQNSSASMLPTSSSHSHHDLQASSRSQQDLNASAHSQDYHDVHHDMMSTSGTLAASNLQNVQEDENEFYECDTFYSPYNSLAQLPPPV